jgi:hypothetical protein
VRRNVRSRALILATALVAGLFSFAPSASAHCGNLETVNLYTFTVAIHPMRKVYEVGDTAKFHMKVTRPGPQDPLGLGQSWNPPMHEPAEDVNVGIGLRVGQVFLFGIGTTNQKGEATVGIKLLPYTPSGTASADGVAWKVQHQNTCATVQEIGYASAPRAFRVTR